MCGIKLALLLFLTSCVAGEWVAMNDSNRPDNMTEFLSFVNGKLFVGCPDYVEKDNCDVELNVMPSDNGIVNFFFDKICQKIFDFTFNNMRTTTITKTNFNPDGTLNFGFKKAWSAYIETIPFGDFNADSGLLVVFANFSVPKGCGFGLTEGYAVIDVTEVEIVTVAPKAEEKTSPATIHIIWACVCAGLVGLFVVVAIVGYCLFLKKKKKEDAERAIGPTPSMMSTMGPATNRERQPEIPIVTKDETPKKVTHNSEEIAAISLINNDRLKTLFEIQNEVKKIDRQVEYRWCLASAFDSRAKSLDVFVPIESWVATMNIRFRYFNSQRRAIPEDAAKIQQNRQKYFTLGPPKIKSISDYDMIVCDTMPRYLYNIQVISKTELDEMENLLNMEFKSYMMEYEHLLFRATDTDIYDWLTVKHEGQRAFEKYAHLLDKKTELFKALAADKKVSSFVNLMFFYVLYSDFINKLPVVQRPFLLSRLPLQALMMLMLRPDLDFDMTAKIFSWYVVTAHGMLRKNDWGACTMFVAYPMTFFTKFWYKVNFSRVSAVEIDRIRLRLDVDDPVPNDDWECT